MIPANLTFVANHLWQSTLFAAAVGLLCLALRKQRAQVRHGLWLAASVKFLIPFALLINLGRQFEWRGAATLAQSPLPVAMEQISQPFTHSAGAPVMVAHSAANGIPVVLFAIWVCGFLAIVFAWLARWRNIRAAVRAASPLRLDVPLRAMSTRAPLEPGVFGIVRPVLLLPDGILERLSPAQLQAIIEHELCHVRRRDNLAAAVHMAVESIFWFHPLVWWIGSRLLEERERACDEEVLRNAAEPEVYAEGILNVCKLYLGSPLRCVSGVTGSSLKKRIEEIMTRRMVYNVSPGKKLFLAGAGMLAVAVPIVIGILNASSVRAQSSISPLVFEVASVKENKSGDFRATDWNFLPGGRFTATNTPVRILIAVAYDVPFQSVRLLKGPEWTNSEGYDVEAKAAPGAISQDLSVKAREAKMKLMLQRLLADRFKLVLRRESKELPVYTVVVAKSGLKLQKAKIEEKDCPDGTANYVVRCHAINGGMGRGLHGRAVEISDIVSAVENWSDRPMVDQTGLKGLYEVESEGWAPMRPRPRPPGEEPTAEDTAMADPTRPTLFTIFDRLGLKMESGKAPVDILVIDHVERPSEN